MYGLVLFVHSWLRWALLVVLVLVLVRAYQGLFQKKPWEKQDKLLHLGLLITSHLQLLLGLWLYFISSPFGSAAFKNGMKTVMKNKLFRFWAVEHLVLMLGALAFVQIGYSLAKRREDAQAKHKAAVIWYTLALVAIFLAIPWPFRAEIGRLWFRF